MRVLIVQRRLTHYRKLLLRRISQISDIEFDVFDVDGTPGDIGNGTHRSFPGKRMTLSMFGKRTELVYSNALVRAVVEGLDEYDVIILEGATNLLINLSLMRALKGRKPFVVWDAGRRKNAKISPQRRLAQLPLMSVWKGAVAIMAYSTLAKRYFIEQGIEERKVFVCQNTLSVHDFDNEIAAMDPSAVDVLRSQLSIAGPMVLYVGAIERRKRLDDLLIAFSLVKERIPDAGLVVVGGGDDLDRCKGVTRDLGLDDVSFAGPVIDGVIAYFIACDLFVLPSEGGLSINQAMICSKPVIASSADGTELDLIRPGINGLLFDEGDIGQLAAQMEELLSDPHRLSEMGVESRKVIDNEVNEHLFVQSLMNCIDFTLGKE